MKPAHRALSVASLAILRRPVPLGVVRGIRQLSGKGNPFLEESFAPHSGSELRHPRLRELLADQELGTWALGARTLDWLESRLGQLRPTLVLEFGSGISTVCLAQFLADIHGAGDVVRVVSIDQDEAYARQTQELLEHGGLDTNVRVLWAPLVEQLIEGRTTTCYAVPSELAAMLGERRAEFVLIDGPAAETRMRFGTLPLARPYLADGSAFILDDGLRDGEIWVASEWAKLPGLRVDGILPLEKGLVIGSVVTARS